MNKDEITSLIVKLLIAVLTPLAAKFNIDGQTTAALATALASLAVIIYGIYDHWNMKKVPENAKVVGLFLIGAILALTMGATAQAADVGKPAAKNPLFSSTYPYQTSGFFFGLYTEGGGGSVNGSVPGVGSASLTTTQAGVGGTLGYAWGAPGSQIAYSVEGDFGWTNFNGSIAGFSLSGPLAFEQRFVAFTPLNSLLSLLPNLNLGTIPPFPGLPAGVTASNLQLGLMAGLDENDISPNFPGLAQNKEWRIAPMIGLVAMEQLSNGVALRSWVKTVFPDKSVCVGPIGASACAGLGQQVKVGVGIYF